MKVLIPTGGFYPANTYGGPVVSLYNLCRLLHDRIDFVIITSNHELNDMAEIPSLINGWNKKYFATTYYYCDEKLKESNFLKIVENEKPDVVYLNSLFEARFVLPFLRICKKKQIPVLMAPRGQLNYGAFKKKLKKFLYLYYIKHFLRPWAIFFQSTCEEETNCIKKYLCKDSNKILHLNNIPSLPNGFIEHKKAKGSARIVFFGRIHPKKNLLFAIKVINSIKSAKLQFDIYGPIEDEDYWEKCLIEIKNKPQNIDIAYCGIINHEVIFDTISKYDLFFFPTISENYGHVIAESLGSGTPVLISDNTPWNDVEKEGAGWALNLSKNAEFARCVEKIANMDDSTINARAYEYFMKKAKIDELKECYYSAFLLVSTIKR